MFLSPLRYELTYTMNTLCIVVVCLVLSATVVGATSSKIFLIYVTNWLTSTIERTGIQNQAVLAILKYTSAQQ